MQNTALLFALLLLRRGEECGGGLTDALLLHAEEWTHRLPPLHPRSRSEHIGYPNPAPTLKQACTYTHTSLSCHYSIFLSLLFSFTGSAENGAVTNKYLHGGWTININRVRFLGKPEGGVIQIWININGITLNCDENHVKTVVISNPEGGTFRPHAPQQIALWTWIWLEINN